MAYERGTASGQSFAQGNNRKNPYQKFNFLVDIDDFGKSGFQTCTGLEKSVNVVEYRDGGDHNSKRKEPGWVNYPNITLGRGMSDDQDMKDWANKSMNIDGETISSADMKRDLTITLQDPSHTARRKWEVYDAFVVNYKFDDLDSESDDFLIETIELAHEGWKEVSVS